MENTKNAIFPQIRFGILPSPFGLAGYGLFPKLRSLFPLRFYTRINRNTIILVTDQFERKVAEFEVFTGAKPP
jgi:hypothetical protein